MKKILYTLFMASLLSVACTEEILVSRDHDLDAEVTDIETKMEMTTLYCNLNDTGAVDLEKLSLYLTAKDADVVTFVAPATVSGTSFELWLTDFASANGYALVAAQTNKTDGRLTMAAIVKSDLAEAVSLKNDVRHEPPLNNEVLLFSVNDINFVVTEMNEARNAIPSDWQSQVAAMLKNHKTADIVYDPDVLAERKAEMTELLNRTLDKEAMQGAKNWMWCVDMNAPSNVDMKYGKEFRFADCYDMGDVSEAEYIKTHHSYFTVKELLTASDAYFKANDLLVYAGLVDCVAVQHSVYTPTSTDGTRHNFLYSSDGLWNIIETLNVDKSADWGAYHYPIMVTLKVEE